mgnify:CR=1 FL=1
MDYKPKEPSLWFAGVNDITTTANTKAQKVIENGQVLIIKDGKKYNLLGNQVK